jgi:photosystem II stability/assembly factor-like uncharacterized protein
VECRGSLPTTHLLDARRIAFADELQGWMLARTEAQDTSKAFRVLSDDESLGEFWIGGHAYSLLDTTDGGSHRRPAIAFPEDMYSLSVAGGGVAVCGAGGKLVWRPNPEASLIEVPIVQDVDLFAVSMWGEATCVAVGTAGTLVFSVDGGASWGRLTLSEAGELYGIHLSSARGGGGGGPNWILHLRDRSGMT